MPVKRARIAPGDVLEFDVRSGRGIAQYVGEHHELGGTLWVVPDIVPSNAEVTHDVLDRDGYYTFFPVKPAVQKSLVRVLGPAPLGSRAVPRLMRRAGVIDRSGAVLTWIISDGERERVVRQLSPEERALPIEEIWNLEMLVLRIAEGWRPERDAPSSSEASSGEHIGATVGESVHYLYFPAAEQARAVKGEIEALGLGVEMRPAAMGPDWLVRVTAPAGPDLHDPSALSERLADIAKRAGGEYDGWEQRAQS